MEKESSTMIAVDSVIRDRLKVHAAKTKKSMKELTDAWLDYFLKQSGE